MQTHAPGGLAPDAVATPEHVGELDRLGDEIATLSVLLAETALHQELDPGTAGERYQVVIHVDAPVLADPEQPGQSVLEDGARVPAGTSQRLACDASRVVMRHDADGRLMEIGARTRTIPPGAAPGVTASDRGCRFPGRPDGRPVPEVPEPGLVPQDPVDALRSRNREDGAEIGARAASDGHEGTGRSHLLTPRGRPR